MPNSGALAPQPLPGNKWRKSTISLLGDNGEKEIYNLH